jgi:hypothetical protein
VLGIIDRSNITSGCRFDDAERQERIPNAALDLRSWKVR